MEWPRRDMFGAVGIAAGSCQVLNEGLSGGLAHPIIADEQVNRCGACHGQEGQRKDALGKMTRGSCHTSLSDKHPSVSAAQ